MLGFFFILSIVIYFLMNNRENINKTNTAAVFQKPCISCMRHDFYV